MYSGRIGKLDEPIEFEKLVNKIEMVLEEPVRKWKNNERLIKKTVSLQVQVLELLI